MLRTVTLFGLLLASTTAPAAETCPWEARDGLEASASMTTVTIEGQTWSVAGDRARTEFMGVLIRCRQERAAEWFQNWRQARMITNVTLATGVCLLPLFYAPFSALAAGVYKDEMIKELSRPASEG